MVFLVAGVGESENCARWCFIFFVRNQLGCEMMMWMRNDACVCTTSATITIKKAFRVMFRMTNKSKKFNSMIMWEAIGEREPLFHLCLCVVVCLKACARNRSPDDVSGRSRSTTTLFLWLIYNIITFFMRTTWVINSIWKRMLVRVERAAHSLRWAFRKLRIISR